MGVGLVRTGERRRGQIYLQFLLTRPVFIVTNLGLGPLHKALRVSSLVVVCVKSEGAELYER